MRAASRRGAAGWTSVTPTARRGLARAPGRSSGLVGLIDPAVSGRAAPPRAELLLTAEGGAAPSFRPEGFNGASENMKSIRTRQRHLGFRDRFRGRFGGGRGWWLGGNGGIGEAHRREFGSGSWWSCCCVCGCG